MKAIDPGFIYDIFEQLIAFEEVIYVVIECCHYGMLTYACG
jgi:hypothetical protein